MDDLPDLSGMTDEEIACFDPTHRPSNLYDQGDEWEAYRETTEEESERYRFDTYE